MSICAQLEHGIVTRSAEACQDLGETLAAELPPDVILALHGDLGVGKTTFVRGLARGFGLTGHLTSPTYTVFNLWHTPRGVTFVHMDAYRLDGPEAVDALMLEDFLVSPFCLALEWPERVGRWLPESAWHLTLGIAAPGEHTVRLQRPT